MQEHMEKYKAAMARYAAARAKAGGLVSNLSKVSTSMSYHLIDFLAANYGLRTGVRQSYGLRDHTYNMPDWPDADSVNATFRELVESFAELRSTWGDIPQEDRNFLKPPPEFPEAK